MRRTDLWLMPVHPRHGFFTHDTHDVMFFLCCQGLSWVFLSWNHCHGFYGCHGFLRCVMFFFRCLKSVMFFFCHGFSQTLEDTLT